jgi:hypothetical protein
VSGKKWFITEAQLARLDAIYDSRPATITMLAREWGTPRWTVQKYAQDRGLARTKELDWSKSDEEYLSANMHRLAVATIARRLKRTRTGVKLKARRLGVRKHGEGYTAQSIALAVGEDPHKVVGWIDQGLLKATRRHTDRENDSYLILEKEVRRFIIENPSKINMRRVDGLWLIDLLANGGG